MPQVKGAANWLTNVRQDTPDDRVRVDNSSVKIENQAAETQLRKNLEVIQIGEHRHLSDREFEIRETNRDIKNYDHMRVLMNENHVEIALGRRKSSVFGLQDLDKNALKEGKHKQGQGPDLNTRKKSTVPRGLPDISGSDDSDDSDTDTRSTVTDRTRLARGSYAFKCPLPLTSNGFSQVRVNDSNMREPPPFNLPGNRLIASRRPRTAADLSRLSKGTRSTNMRTMGFAGTRPMTAYIKLKDRSKTPRPKSGCLAGELLEEEEDIEPFIKHERSFQQLRDLTHIDKIAEQQREAKRRDMEMKKSQLKTQVNGDLQEKLNSFLKDVDRFKQQHVKKKTTFSFEIS